MKKIILVLLILFLYISCPADALEKAAPMDFIFKGGDYKEKITMLIDTPITARIEGSNGVFFILIQKEGVSSNTLGLTTTG